jgi:gliding motility-associated protein GldM
MAGGAKETPRQRMIGFMYLVLTALLALQVSNAVLEKFKFIDDSLQYSVGVGTKATDDLMQGVAAKMKEGSTPKDQQIYAQAQKAQAESQAMLKFMDDLRADLIKATGGVDKETGEPVDGKNYDNSMNYLIGPEGGAKGKAYELKDKLNAYAASMSKYTKTVSVDAIAKDAKDIPAFAKDDNQKSKDFARLNFENTPLVATLAVLSEMKTKVVRAEAQVVSELTKEIGSVAVRLDKIQAMYNAESKVVAAGTKYRAQMFIGASSTSAQPSMSSSAGAIKVDANGVGTLEFTATGGAYDADGNAKKSWEGTIRIKTASGSDTTFTVKADYIVAKPVIQIQSASVAALYRNCGNKLNVQVPALGVAYDPAFSADGAETLRGSKKGEVVVVPSAKEVKLKVSSGGNYIGDQTFSVRLLPKPTLNVRSGGRPLDFKSGGAVPPSITATATADESIKQIIPDDANYRVAEMEITHARGRRPVGSPMRVSGNEANLNNIRANAKEGDRIIIEIKKVQRKNFRGGIEEVAVAIDPFTYSITQ